MLKPWGYGLNTFNLVWANLGSFLGKNGKNDGDTKKSE